MKNKLLFSMLLLGLATTGAQNLNASCFSDWVAGEAGATIGACMKRNQRLSALLGAGVLCAAAGGYFLLKSPQDENDSGTVARPEVVFRGAHYNTIQVGNHLEFVDPRTGRPISNEQFFHPTDTKSAEHFLDHIAIQQGHVTFGFKPVNKATLHEPARCVIQPTDFGRKLADPRGYLFPPAERGAGSSDAILEAQQNRRPTTVIRSRSYRRLIIMTPSSFWNDKRELNRDIMEVPPQDQLDCLSIGHIAESDSIPREHKVALLRTAIAALRAGVDAGNQMSLAAWGHEQPWAHLRVSNCSHNDNHENMGDKLNTYQD